MLAVKYLETLAKVADGQATKVFLPMESMSALGALSGLKEIFSGESSPSNGTALPPMPAVAKKSSAS